jgi:hypothetical protein
MHHVCGCFINRSNANDVKSNFSESLRENSEYKTAKFTMFNELLNQLAEKN